MPYSSLAELAMWKNSGAPKIHLNLIDCGYKTGYSCFKTLLKVLLSHFTQNN